MYTTIKTLWEKGNNKSEIARATGHDWKTVDKVIKNLQKGVEIPKYKERGSIIDPYKEKVIKMLEEGLSGVRIYEELLKGGYPGSYPTVRRYIAKIKASENIFIRINTPPGEEAQVDFGYVGITTDDSGKKRKTWVFSMRLSYSRYDYYQKVYDQKVETFIACHINAFEFFGGVPEVVKIDNIKAAILEANFYEPVYQKMYKHFADYYGFSPLPCRIYRANDKGKVESGIKYVKNNFFKGRSFTSGTELDRKLREWMDKANRRIHGTIRKVPLEVFREKEKDKLKNLPDKRFALPKVGTRKVYHDCHIYVDYNYYSVPYQYIGQEVDIELTDNILRISKDEIDIAVHPVAAGKGNFSTIESHYPKHKRMTDSEYQEIYRSKMAQIGSYAEKMFYRIVKDRPNHWGRTVKGILSLKGRYPKSIIEAACRRAYYFGAASYQIVKRICRNGTYSLPLEEETYEFTKI